LGDGYIWGMNYLKQLDDVLGFIDDGDRPSMSFLSVQREFTDILEIHVERILDKLCNDGYVGKIDGAVPKYWITYDGLMFLSSGGYIAQNRNNRMSNIRASVSEYALIIGGVGAALAGLYSLGKIIQVIYTFFRHYSC